VAKLANLDLLAAQRGSETKYPVIIKLLYLPVRIVYKWEKNKQRGVPSWKKSRKNFNHTHKSTPVWCTKIWSQFSLFFLLPDIFLGSPFITTTKISIPVALQRINKQKKQKTLPHTEPFLCVLLVTPMISFRTLKKKTFLSVGHSKNVPKQIFFFLQFVKNPREKNPLKKFLVIYIWMFFSQIISQKNTFYSPHSLFNIYSTLLYSSFIFECFFWNIYRQKHIWPKNSFVFFVLVNICLMKKY